MCTGRVDRAQGRTVCTPAARATQIFGQHLAGLGEGGLWLHLELVSASGCPFQPLLTPWLFLFPVALQMPEGLLMFACTIADIIER